ncbi:MAG: type II toxin-antitoxin system PemK/MazF family toxin [Beijerinckiaceae bacterium]
MRRRSIWTVSTGGVVGKPRPALIIRDDRFAETDTVTICLITTAMVKADQVRIRIEPTAMNGLRSTSFAMTDKLTTIAKSKIGRPIGEISAADMIRIEQAVLLYLGFASQSS